MNEFSSILHLYIGQALRKFQFSMNKEGKVTFVSAFSLCACVFEKLKIIPQAFVCESFDDCALVAYIQLKKNRRKRDTRNKKKWDNPAIQSENKERMNFKTNLTEKICHFDCTRQKTVPIVSKSLLYVFWLSHWFSIFCDFDFSLCFMCAEFQTFAQHNLNLGDRKLKLWKIKKCLMTSVKRWKTLIGYVGSKLEPI